VKLLQANFIVKKIICDGIGNNFVAMMQHSLIRNAAFMSIYAFVTVLAFPKETKDGHLQT
jgi:hypothetical protein